ncbi:FabD/lysophospholipase-like protein [Myriangium duriaei CBS 260.36]|uniref:FabD/lysophospholipase-like protein n=1 Tax=Myriangium duriaei CBS 260.36 TaxID=1168546 RepID=A0A9P4ISS9_9PEZI|nr:FabD/lysophospholipase-like protein [Myriangium duriaei CBS 260.36]
MRKYLRKAVAAALEPDQQGGGTPNGFQPQVGYYPEQQYYGSPQQYHGAPQQYHGSLQHYYGSPQHYPGNPQQYPGNPQQYPGNPHQYPGNPQHYPASPPHYTASPQQYQGSQQHLARRPVGQSQSPPQVPSRPPPRSQVLERDTQSPGRSNSSTPNAWLQPQSTSELALVQATSELALVPANPSVSSVPDTALTPATISHEASRTDSASSYRSPGTVPKLKGVESPTVHEPAVEDDTPQSMPEASDGRPPKPKVLCLDGGGVRGYSEIIMLEYLMQQLNGQRGFDLEPWQEFDMIVGTSTGGLLAIMLGRLKMSVAQCKQAYADLMGQVFEKTRAEWNKAGKAKDLWQVRGKFSAAALEKGICDLLESKDVDVNELLWERNPGPKACKVVVCAVDQTSGAEYIRTYKNTKRTNDLLSHCKIWQAARATSAASTFFDPIEIGPDGRIFADGGLRNNNPIEAAYSEARDMFPDSKDDLIFVTLGTGVEVPIADMNANLQVFVDVMKNIVTETEHTYQRFYDNHPEMVQDRLHRFNVPQGLATVGLEEHARRRDVVNFTLSYCKRSDAADAFRRCAESLESNSTPES